MKRFLKFWGTRGSCSVCGPEYCQFGGNTCCLEVRYDDTFFIIDAGTGIRPLGESIKETKIDLFLSHTHWDHIIGFPFFDPIYENGVKITIWAPRGSGRSCKELFEELLGQEFFPINLNEVHADLEFKTIEERKPVQMGPITLDFFHTHHPGVTLCFKIKTPHQTISYVTDNEIHSPVPQGFIDFHKHSDLFIHEAQYTSEEYRNKTGWGHSSLDDAITLVQKVQPKRWVITHHDPQHSDTKLKDLESLAKKKVSCPIEWIGDGHVIPLT